MSSFHASLGLEIVLELLPGISLHLQRLVKVMPHTLCS